MNPDKDVTIVVAGEAAQTAAMLGNKQVDALSQFDTQYALTEQRRRQAALSRSSRDQEIPLQRLRRPGGLPQEQPQRGGGARARGTPRERCSPWPTRRPRSASSRRCIRRPRPPARTSRRRCEDDLITLEARARNWRYEQVDGKRWGDNVVKNYQDYPTGSWRRASSRTKTDANDLVTNELLDEVINFDEKALIAEAKAYKAK